MRMKVLDQKLLLTLNQSSIASGRSQNLKPERLASEAPAQSWINAHVDRERDGQGEVRVCVVLDLFNGRTAWLDLSSEEFQAIPELDLSEEDWETAMCAGTPPTVP